MRDVVIAGYLRTAQSRSRPTDPPRDWFHKVRADELLARLLPEILTRAKVKPEEVDDFIVGSALGVTEQWTYGGRTLIFLANLPETVPAKFVDQQCGSAMAAVHIGYLEVASGNAEIVLAGGMEHMTRIPMETADAGIAEKLRNLPEFCHWNMEVTMNMGLTAEKLFAISGLSREDLDWWALRSHELAQKAKEEGFFDGEILPVEAEQADGSVLTVSSDQSIRAGSTLEAMAGLKPVFKADGVITAGNASPLNAGASSMVLMTKETAMKKGIKPLATIRAMGLAGVDPTIMGSGPVPASRKALQSAGLRVEDIDYWEINEAFSVVTLYCIQQLGIDPDKVNVRGGGLALGHPLGATGIRLIGTLARILNERKACYGMATACVGGGQGVATLVERYRG